MPGSREPGRLTLPCWTTPGGRAWAAGGCPGAPGPLGLAAASRVTGKYVWYTCGSPGGGRRYGCGTRAGPAASCCCWGGGGKNEGCFIGGVRVCWWPPRHSPQHSGWWRWRVQWTRGTAAVPSGTLHHPQTAAAGGTQGGRVNYCSLAAVEAHMQVVAGRLTGFAWAGSMAPAPSGCCSAQRCAACGRPRVGSRGASLMALPPLTNWAYSLRGEGEDGPGQQGQLQVQSQQASRGPSHAVCLCLASCLTAPPTCACSGSIPRHDVPSCAPPPPPAEQPQRHGMLSR